jgi:DNA primase
MALAVTTRKGPVRVRDRYDLDEIKRRHPIEAIVGADLPLKRSGSAYHGLCPFHAERTPSFYVYPAAVSQSGGHFHCFGCPADSNHGSVFDYVMRRSGLTFLQAVERLGGRPRSDLAAFWKSLEAPAAAASPAARPVVMASAEEREVMRAAMQHYQRQLWRDPQALAYLQVVRGLNPTTIQAARLGLGGGLIHALRRDSAAIEVARRLGLLATRDDFDRFTGRIVCAEWRRDAVSLDGSTHSSPIWLTGRVQPGRVVVCKPEAKYLDVSSLSGPLVGLDEARSVGAPRGGGVLIVEGYFDMMAARQLDYTAVALTGTSPGDLALGELRALLEGGLCAYVVPDRDRAGRVGMLGRNTRDREAPADRHPGLVRRLALPVGTMGVVRLPLGVKDLGDLLRDPHGHAVLAQRVSAAYATRQRASATCGGATHCDNQTIRRT